MADNDNVKVVFRVSTSGLEADITLPTKITGQQLIQRVLKDQSMKIPKHDPQGNAYSFDLNHKEKGQKINTLTLAQAGVKNGDTLILLPVIVAGKN